MKNVIYYSLTIKTSMESSKVSKGAVVYARTAPEGKVVDELKKQERVCNIFANTLNMKVLKSFRDVSSGTSLQRPGFQDLLSFCEDNAEKVGAIIITDRECLMIDVSDYFELGEMLGEYGVEIICLDKSFSEEVV
ncbi:hypothetical protein A2704_05605 [Candidatus Kaiserbacteria bacterium RIFCSPHIGHO2_01_FULL_54_36b]|uniref:Resolvase/invertase-type recombinase catalytic domain-containing protein n=1 Tax=Candidatus Kaiserbacteria bacterium RIFCSPHIGHO2_01_FULL_54_36b TaxID=1798483 RepID=A0A1F6CMC5_9BACT|nr:MAG: hypothetical protein A2704_05605 [Candidatus Kaiserbacteria bacterium RIFCSPHIGHO2_01_FULL_54_36b]